jgi:hypothetical protein
MPPKRTFDAELATLEALRDVSPESAEPELVKALSTFATTSSSPRPPQSRSNTG